MTAGERLARFTAVVAVFPFSPVQLLECSPALPFSAKGEKWSGRADSNCRPLDPQSSALSRLGHAPTSIPSRL